MLEKLQDIFGTRDSLSRAFEEHQGVIGILKNSSRVTGYKGVSDGRGEGGVLKETTKDISDDEEKVGGNGATLPEPSPTVDPVPRDATKEDGSLPAVKEITDLVTPFIRKASAPENVIQTIPVDTIKGFMEVELKNNGRCISTVAAVEQISSISKDVSDAAPKHKPV